MHSLIESVSNIRGLLAQSDENSYCLATTRLESAILACQVELPVQVYQAFLHLLENALYLIMEELEMVGISINPVGRPKIEIRQPQLEYLLSMRFNATQIAKYYKVSRHTIQRRLKDYNLSVIEYTSHANL